MKTRPRSLGERLRWKISWMTSWPGPVGGVRLAREDDLDRPVGVPQQVGEPIHVAEQQAGPLVGRETSREADRQDARVERALDLGEHRRRLAVARELAAQPAPGEDRELALLAEVAVPQLAGRDAAEALPEAVLARTGVEGVEVGVEEARQQLVDRASRPRSARGRRW